MKFCQRHWDALKAAIDARGLTPFVATSGEQIVAKARAEIEIGTAPSNFDPLMTAHNLILSKAISVGLFEIFLPNPDGTDRCPICFFQEICKCGKPTCKENYEKWIEYSANDTVAIAEKHGIVAKS